MPQITPKQKIDRTKHFGGKYIKVILCGDTFDEASAEAKKFARDNQLSLIPPFDDPYIIQGQATVGYEIFEQAAGAGVFVDYIIVPVGGGGLISGVGGYARQNSKKTKNNRSRAKRRGVYGRIS